MCLLSVCFCVMHTSTSVRTFVRQVAHSTNFVKKCPFFDNHPKKSKKRDIQQKLQYLRLPCTNCVRGWCSRYGAFFRGFSVLPKNV